MLRRAARFVSYALRHPLGRRDPWGTFGRIARWQLGSRLLGAPAVIPFANGTSLVVETGMSGATGNLYYGLHEVDDMAFVAHALREGELFVDVGANVGSYAILAASVGAQVIACEPVPASFERLVRNVALNQLAGKIRCEQVAASDHVGHVRMTEGLDTMNRVVEEGPSVEVACLPLDALLGGATPVVMKIDVEGHEPAVLRGARETLSRSPWAIVLELEGAHAALGRDLAEHGLVGAHYDPLTRTLSRSDGHGAYNSLFVSSARFDELSRRCREARPIDLGWTEL